MNTRPGSGAIEHCSFTGSVSASCGNDPTGTADAGGICGMAESGNIDFCETTLDAAHTIRTEGGEISMTGGIAGSMNGGRISACTFTGTGVLEAAFNTVPEGYYVYAQAGGIVGSTAEASIESCTADFGGSLLVPERRGSNLQRGHRLRQFRKFHHRLYRKIYGRRLNREQRRHQLRRRCRIALRRR